MVEFTKVYPLDGMWAPRQVRFELRSVFGRWLSRAIPPQPRSVPENVVDELSMLELCQYYQLEYPGSAENLARTWDESEQRIADGGPSFDELIRTGWLCYDGGRWSMHSTLLGTSSHISFPSPSTKEFLTELGKARLVAKIKFPPANVQALAEKITSEGWLEQGIPTKSPKWLARRLWERLCPKPQTYPAVYCGSIIETISVKNEDIQLDLLGVDDVVIDKAFLEWSAWCKALRIDCNWDISWEPLEMKYCREAAFRALNRQKLWSSWDIDTSLYMEVLRKTFGVPAEQMRYSRVLRKELPQTLVFQAEWLKWPDVEHLMMGRLVQYSTASFALNVLLSELDKTDISSSVMETAASVLSFAADHPVALLHLLFRVDAAPELLVDMLMTPCTACLAVKLIIGWQSWSAHNNDRALVREVRTKAFAVQDSLSFLAHHLKKDKLDLAEYASLVTWCYVIGAESRKAVADSYLPVGRILLEILARENEKSQLAVLQHLLEQAEYENNVPRACFAGVLNALNCFPSIQLAEAFPITELYLKFVRDLNLDRTDASSLSESMVGQLFRVALMQPELERDAILFPIGSKKLLENKREDERFSLQNSISRTQREHIRLLSRAVSGWPDKVVPNELCEALQKLVSNNVIEHAEKGRLGSLTDRYNLSSYSFSREEGSPAKDLSAAWRRLNSSDQKSMLQVFTQSDDPVLLAELCQYLPAANKNSIRDRLRQLKPSEASVFWTWPELERRIVSLLDADEVELAREHLDEAKQDLERAASPIKLNFFSLWLRLFLKEKNWAALDRAVVPTTLKGFEAQQAKDQLDFYRATSELLRTKGDLVNARNVLQRLAASPGAPTAYKENAFAVAIQQLMGPSFNHLSGDDRVAGERLLAEINAIVDVEESLPNSSLLFNRAILLLALRRPAEALESVTPHRLKQRIPKFEIVTALAKSELGLRDEAMAVLDAAIEEFDENDQFKELKSDLQAGTNSQFFTYASDEVDHITSIRVALQKLTELNSCDVGNILGPTGGGVNKYLIREVSRSLASLQQMAAMLRDRKDPKNDAKLEDDLNTAVRELLAARLSIVKWNVSDQSLGGSTLRGNPGERDIVIRSSGTELSIIEALVCSNVDKANIKKHFDKLLPYGICSLYFHVIYSYLNEVGPLLKYVEKMLKSEIPYGLTFLYCEPLKEPDYQVAGYVATYRLDHRDITVVFMVVDLRSLSSGVTSTTLGAAVISS